MNQVKNINAVIFLTMGAMFTTMLDNATGSGIFKIAALTMDLLVITWCFLKTKNICSMKLRMTRQRWCI